MRESQELQKLTHKSYNIYLVRAGSIQRVFMLLFVMVNENFRFKLLLYETKQEKTAHFNLAVELKN